MPTAAEGWDAACTPLNAATFGWLKQLKTWPVAFPV